MRQDLRTIFTDFAKAARFDTDHLARVSLNFDQHRKVARTIGTVITPAEKEALTAANKEISRISDAIDRHTGPGHRVTHKAAERAAVGDAIGGKEIQLRSAESADGAAQIARKLLKDQRREVFQRVVPTIQGILDRHFQATIDTAKKAIEAEKSAADEIGVSMDIGGRKGFQPGPRTLALMAHLRFLALSFAVMPSAGRNAIDGAIGLLDSSWEPSRRGFSFGAFKEKVRDLLRRPRLSKASRVSLQERLVAASKAAQSGEDFEPSLPKITEAEGEDKNAQENTQARAEAVAKENDRTAAVLKKLGLDRPKSERLAEREIQQEARMAEAREKVREQLARRGAETAAESADGAAVAVTTPEPAPKTTRRAKA